MTRSAEKPVGTSQDFLHLTQLNAVRLLAVLAIGIGYASTMSVGLGQQEWGHHWGYDPSWYGIQVLFVISGWLAMRSLNLGKTPKQYLISRACRTYPLLILVTTIVVLILYPLFAAPEARTWASVPKLARYFLETATLIRPSQPLPGLMEGAKYDCLVQGAIWTLRWGAVFHIAVALIWRFGILQRQHALLAGTIAAMIAYAVAIQYTVTSGTDILRPLVPGLKLGYAFGAGMTAYHLKNRLPQSGKLQLIILIALACSATAFAILTPQGSRHWTPSADILGSMFWGYLALLALQKRVAIFRNWPNLVLPTFLTLWPTAQVLLLLSPNIPTFALIVGSLAFSLSFAFGIAYLRTWRDHLFGEAAVKPT
ncbi:hypothetical protein ACJ3XI_09880 [Litorimonas sp. RW-G-Af-16]|uniref:hypothetical protein n=1 Tax=Litorimonas sp. RW-G-Af-16 TaxID=3241168 RepID=UPI00390C6273